VLLITLNAGTKAPAINPPLTSARREIF